MTTRQPPHQPATRRVYIYWRQVECFSREDARLKVYEYLEHVRSHHA